LTTLKIPCRRADAERQTQNGGASEGGVLPQLAEGEFEVVHGGEEMRIEN
jgi:hypothetical protein